MFVSSSLSSSFVDKLASLLVTEELRYQLCCFGSFLINAMSEKHEIHLEVFS